MRWEYRHSNIDQEKKIKKTKFLKNIMTTLTYQWILLKKQIKKMPTKTAASKKMKTEKQGLIELFAVLLQQIRAIQKATAIRTQPPAYIWNLFSINAYV